MNASTTTMMATEPKASYPDLTHNSNNNLELQDQDQYHPEEEYESTSHEDSQHGSGQFPADEEVAEKQADANPIDNAAPNAVTRTNTKVSINNVAAIPNGGLLAWTQVLGAWILFFDTWGIVNTFGAYQTYYLEPTSLLHTSSSSDLSWVGAVQAFLLMLVGALTGPIYDAGYFRELLWTGSFLIVLGQMMLSLCGTYWQVFLAQAICIGIGTGLLFVPSVSILSQYFSTKISVAVGVAATGSSIGGVIYPIVFHRLQPTIGFPWATRVIGFIQLITLVIPCTVMKVRVLPPAKRKLFDLSAFKELPYLLFTLGGVIGFAGLYVPFFYIQYYAITTGATDQNLGFYLLAVLNSASVFGRTLPNLVAGKLGGLNIITPCAGVTALLIWILLAVKNAGGLIVFCIFYGFFSGTFVSLPPSIFVSLTQNRALIGTRMGMGFACMSFGVLAGTPIAGAILGSENNFTGIWIFGAALTTAGTALFVAARFCKTGMKLVVRA